VAEFEKWDTVTVSIIECLMANNEPLPIGFFSQSVERLQALAEALGNKLQEQMPAFLMAHTAEDETCEGPKMWFWNYALLIKAAELADWDSGDEESISWLRESYRVMNRMFLNWYYNPNVLNEVGVQVLPAAHRFGWLYMQAEDERKQERFSECLRLLRSALDTAPYMKRMVQWEVRQVENDVSARQPAPSEELLELAEKVRAVLAAYAPDDPAVVALKATPAYQSVAHLIERN